MHGPGCPVCVTPLELIDRAIAIAQRPEVIMTSFGDMLRVPGSKTDLLSVKAQGGDVRMVYSPLDAVKLAQKHPDRQVVFFAVGFETTAPGNAMSVWHAQQLGLTNFSILCSHVLVPPAMEAILGAPGNMVQGFLAAGHVCSVMGYWEYEPLAEKYRLPIVVTGFEPLDLLQGIYMTVLALEEGRSGVENQYSRAVTRAGNVSAQRLISQVFDVTDRKWRGIGVIPAERLPAEARVRPVRRGAAFRRGRGHRALNRRYVSQGRSCAASRSRTTARRSARSARPNTRWARRWCRQRARARPTISMGGQDERFGFKGAGCRGLCVAMPDPYF